MGKRVFGHKQIMKAQIRPHPRSLIRVFAVRKQNHWILQKVSMASKCPDETLRMCRMMWICTFCAYSKALFRLTQHMPHQVCRLAYLCNLWAYLLCRWAFRDKKTLPRRFGYLRNSVSATAMLCTIIRLGIAGVVTEYPAIGLSWAFSCICLTSLLWARYKPFCDAHSCLWEFLKSRIELTKCGSNFRISLWPVLCIARRWFCGSSLPFRIALDIAGSTWLRGRPYISKTGRP